MTEVIEPPLNPFESLSLQRTAEMVKIELHFSILVPSNFYSHSKLYSVRCQKLSVFCFDSNTDELFFFITFAV